jgi:hypothetical protein
MLDDLQASHTNVASKISGMKTNASFNVDTSSIGFKKPESLNSLAQAFRRKIDFASHINIKDIKDLEDSKLTNSNNNSIIVDTFVDSTIGAQNPQTSTFNSPRHL